jgi:hypothetical protein
MEPVRARRDPTFALSFAAFAKKYFILSLAPMWYTRAAVGPAAAGRPSNKRQNKQS